MSSLPVQVYPGLYTATYNSNDIGITTGDGWALRFSHLGKKINNSANYGKSLLDGIYQGGNCQLIVTLKEWRTATKQIIWPWSNTSAPVFDGKMGQMGTKMSTAAKTIVLTAETGSPAAVNAAPATLTANYACPSLENDMSVLLAPDERDVAIIFDLLPYWDSSVNRWFTLT